MQLSQHFTYRKILSAALSPIVMMLFTSLYSVVDGLFLSCFSGRGSFAAVSFITPCLMMFNSAGFMFGTGGSALIARIPGEKMPDYADSTFSSPVLASVVTGVLPAGPSLLSIPEEKRSSCISSPAGSGSLLSISYSPVCRSSCHHF